MKIPMIILGSALLVSFSAAGYVLRSGDIKVEPKKDLRAAKTLDLDLSQKERGLKSEISSLRRNDKSAFQSRLDDQLTNPPLYQGYLYEIRDGRDEIERAKEIARVQIHRALRTNWLDVKKTVLNDTAATDWKGFETRLRRRLENMIYVPVAEGQPKDRIQFQIEDWGFITVYKKKNSLDRVKWSFNIASLHDGNKLQEGVEQITTE